ncbi:integrase arm-type DNA-binding domain-containing protein [Sulfitobacter sp. OXR-159]|uniref:tyrosine-type recombinase/integrase n=1 Tax=Sulfitobacter sp. OXR-159 TaxID=3100174 RepID=UPI002AC92C8D|nr:integrase arm-type DNA-binding domain-containing protein [Sulfitobacter sp. OXR-159]WPZ29003.1 integrase arm-type DNA-binding domain-containing protein [Sulfitobacter sp. OXR-159]
MPLTAMGIKKAPDGKHEDGNGLRLLKKGERGSWVYRYSIWGKRKEMGLGSWPAVTLAEARKIRDRWAAELREGRDPISVRRQQREADALAAQRADPTFAQMVDMVFEARKATLRGDGKRGKWRSALDTHIIPKIGRKPISQITVQDVQGAMAPIWHTKPSVSVKAYQRTRLVFSKAKLMGHDCDPFTVDAAKEVLGAVEYIPTPIPATPWQEIPALYARLSETKSDVAQCLRWIILTMVRSDAARGAHLDEIEDSIWTVPAERVKGLRNKTDDFRVPVTDELQRIADEQAQIHSGLMFTGLRGRPVTSRGLEKHLDSIGEAGRPHGFRTSFRTWVQDTDACSFEVAETILGHAINTKVQRAYARSDLLDRRRLVMEAWARFVTGEGAATVTQLRGT